MERQRLRPPNTEVGLASGLLALGLFESLTSGAAHWAQLVVAVVLQTVPLAWRRTTPATAAVLAFAGVLVELSTGSTKADAAGFLSFMILCFSVPRYTRPIGMLVGGLVLAAGTAVHELGSGYVSASTATVQIAFDATIAGAAWTVGVLIRRRAAQAEGATSAYHSLIGEWASREQAIVDEERRRIARELHDIIGHALAGISLSAGAAEHAGAAASVEVREALIAIRSTSQTAAADVRRLLGLLRTASDYDLVPPPSLGTLPELISRAKASGADVTFNTSGHPTAVSTGLQLAVYRIVQEGLTNVTKHSPGSTADVDMTWSPAALGIVITNNGSTIVGPPDPTGRGLAGVRERVELYGGTFQAGPRG